MITVSFIPEDWDGDNAKIVLTGDEEWSVIDYSAENDEAVVIATSDNYLELVDWFKEKTRAGNLSV